MDSKTEPASEAKERIEKKIDLFYNNVPENERLYSKPIITELMLSEGRAERERSQKEIAALKAIIEKLAHEESDANKSLRSTVAALKACIEKHYAGATAEHNRAQEEITRLKAELEKERELRKQILKGLESLERLYYAGYTIYPESLKPLIEKSKN